MTEPMVLAIEVQCLKCGFSFHPEVLGDAGLNGTDEFGPPIIPVSFARRVAEEGRHYYKDDPWATLPEKEPATRDTERCGGRFQFVFEPVPDMGTPYPATERDEDSEYEYAREDAPLLQEDRL